jgi:putative ABC transport system substrate-binding protein
MMRRRQFVTLLGGAAAWPVAAHAQRPNPMRRVAVISQLAADDPEVQARMAAFHRGLQEAGWSVGRNVRIDYRWGRAGDSELTRQHIAEVIALAPEVILGVATSTVTPLLQMTRTIPVVFVQVTDPVASGFVASLARPGGNATGFTLYEFGLSAKWLELLKEVAPRTRRAAVLRDPTLSGSIGHFGAMQSVAPSLGVELIPIGVRDAGEIERGLTQFGAEPNYGMIVLPGSLTVLHRKLIIAMAAKQHLPAVYPFRYHVADGGLISYGVDSLDPYRRAASYVDRILKGEKPADLPVQASTKYELVINLKTAKALGLDVPPTLLARADEVIE